MSIIFSSLIPIVIIIIMYLIAELTITIAGYCESSTGNPFK